MLPHTKKIVDELCNYLGYDFGSPMCNELHDHIQECPECQEYLDSVELTVKLCKDSHKKAEVPEEVKKKLLELVKSRK